MTADHWQDYQRKLKIYHKNDKLKDKAQFKIFDEEMRKVRKLCDEQEEFQRGVQTKIIKQSKSSQNINTDILSSTACKNISAPKTKEISSFDKLFMKLISEQTTYVIGVKDPIQASFDELVEGLRLFNERFGIRNLFDSFIDMVDEKAK